MLRGTHVAAAMAAATPVASKGGPPGYCATASRVAMRLRLQHTSVATSRASFTAACGSLLSSRSSNSTPRSVLLCCSCCSKCGNHRWFSFLRDPQSLKRVLAELAAAEKAAEQHSNISSSGIEGDEKALADPCPSSYEENEEFCLHSSYASCNDGSSISDSSSRSRVTAKCSSHDEGDSDEPPPVQVRAEVVLSREQQMMLDEAEASAAATAAADRQKRFLDSVAAAESTEGGLRGALQQSFDALLPPSVTAAAAAPRPSEAGGPHATGDAAGGSTASARACEAGGFVWNETDEAALTPAQRFYRDNRELLLQRAEQYLRGKQAAAASATGGASAADEEEWDDAARTLEEDWKAYFNPVYKQPKGFRWPVADTAESSAAAAPPLDMEFRKGQYPSLEEFKSLLAQEGVKDVVCLNLEALSRRDLGLVALIGTCGTAAHCRRVSRLLRSIITSLEIPVVSDSCSSTSGSTRRNRSRRSTSSSEWFVACLGPVSVHLMTAAARDFYDVERIWRSTGELQEQQQQAHEGSDEDLLLLPSTGEQEDMLQQHQRLVLQQLQQLQQKQEEQS